MEYIILSHLKFELVVPTVAFFLGHLIELGVEEDRKAIWPHDLTRRLVERLLCEPRFSKSLASVLATNIYDFLLRNFVMTSVVARMSLTTTTPSGDKHEPPITDTTVIDNFYQMLFVHLANRDDL